ncbi:hypothetical protein F511_38511 [Dorcoceras hygrometricum]|uniref:Uncharacterized protein n=1 Tax=Dorcoceras hygrometricum TaxID=472368 RepID=A0A2Z7B3L1_9LAMI|nr:hypothetical protein F511_38511 [Dorcoceras hygrometricum]
MANHNQAAQRKQLDVRELSRRSPIPVLSHPCTLNSTGSNPSTESNIVQQVDRTSYKCNAMHENRKIKGSKGTIQSWTSAIGVVTGCVREWELPSRSITHDSTKRSIREDLTLTRKHYLNGRSNRSEYEPTTHCSSFEINLLAHQSLQKRYRKKRLGKRNSTLPILLQAMPSTVGNRRKYVTVNIKGFVIVEVTTESSGCKLLHVIQFALPEQIVTHATAHSYRTDYALQERKDLNPTEAANID